MSKGIASQIGRLLAQKNMLTPNIHIKQSAKNEEKLEGFINATLVTKLCKLVQPHRTIVVDVEFGHIMRGSSLTTELVHELTAIVFTPDKEPILCSCSSLTCRT